VRTDATAARQNELSRRSLVRKFLPTIGWMLLAPTPTVTALDRSSAGRATQHQLKNIWSDGEVYRAIARDWAVPIEVQQCAYKAHVECRCLIAFNGYDPRRQLLGIAADHPRFKGHVMEVLKVLHSSTDEWCWPKTERSDASRELGRLFRDSLISRYPTDHRLVTEIQ